MPPGEVFWRVRHTLADSAGALIAQLGYKSPAPPALQEARADAWPPPRESEVAAYVAVADQVLAGHVDLYGERVNVGRIPHWNRDPMGNKAAPLQFGKLLDYRDVELVGNARNTWELNRHFQLVTLAQAWALTGQERYRQGADDLLASWLSDCPYPMGVNWASALEHGIRLINWYIAARILNTRSYPLQCSRAWLDSIYRHCQFIWSNQSRYSSANNHLIGEMAGLYVTATAWPCWDNSAKWRSDAKRILLEEAQRQVHSDGVSREQTVGYQAFVLQFLIMAGLVGEANDDPFPVEYWTTVRRMLNFLRSIMNVAGKLPDFGDSDDGFAYVLTPDARSRRYHDLLEFESAVTKADSVANHGPASASDWLRSGFPLPKAWPKQEIARRREFPDGGYFVLGENFGEKDEVVLVFDAAPLGYLSIAAHGHADCLSFVLSLSGRHILIDPGTYCYHSDPVWRDYFRSTAAHNTVRIDGMDQSEIAGPFMWLSKANPTMERLELVQPVQVIKAKHDGYSRLSDPVIHSRELRLDSKAKTLDVIDTISCSGVHEIERFWHFDDACDVRATPGLGYLVTAPDIQLQLDPGDCTSTELLHGNLSPRSGWISRVFGARLPTSTLVVRSSIDGPAVLRTSFRWQVAKQDCN